MADAQKRTIPLYSNPSETPLNLFKFYSKTKVDLNTFVAPVKFHRKRPVDPNAGKVGTAAGRAANGTGAKVDDAMDGSGGSKSANEPAKSSVAPYGNKPKAANQLFKRKTREVFLPDPKTVQLQKEEAQPLIVKDRDGKEKWEAQLESGERSSYAFLVFSDNGFRVVPVHKRYVFRRDLKYTPLTSEEAEEAMAKQSKRNEKQDRWFMERRKKAEGIVEAGGEDAPYIPKLKITDATPRRKTGGDMDEVDYEEEFQDDEDAGFLREMADDETLANLERQKRDVLKDRMLDDDDDDVLSDEQPKHLSQQGKKMMKMIRKDSGEEDQYDDADEDKDPYASIADEDDIDMELEVVEETPKEEKAKEAPKEEKAKEAPKEEKAKEAPKEEKAKETLVIGEPARELGTSALGDRKHSSVKPPISKRKKSASSPSWSSRGRLNSASVFKSGDVGLAQRRVLQAYGLMLRKVLRDYRPRVSSPLATSPVIQASLYEAVSALRSDPPPSLSRKRKEDGSGASCSATRKVRAVTSSQGRPVPGSAPHASGKSTATTLRPVAPAFTPNHVHAKSPDAVSALQAGSTPSSSKKRKSDALPSANRKVRAIASSRGQPVPGPPSQASGETTGTNLRPVAPAFAPSAKKSSIAKVSAISPPEQPVVLNRMVFEQEFIDYMGNHGHPIAVKDVIKNYKHEFKHPASKQIIIDTIRKCANTDNSVVTLKEEWHRIR